MKAKQIPTIDKLCIVIAAASKPAGWGDYEAIDKYSMPVHGKPMLKRLAAQIQAAGEKFDDLHIVTRVPAHGDGIGTLHAVENDTPLNGTWLGDSVAAWGKNRRNLVLFGEAVFSDAALKIALSIDGDKPVWLGRSGPGKHKRNHREIFAVSIPADSRAAVLGAMVTYSGIRPANAAASVWPVYQILQGRQPGTFSTEGNWIEIDDETETFKLPGDYTAWRRLFEPGTKGYQGRAHSKVEVIRSRVNPVNPQPVE